MNFEKMSSNEAETHTALSDFKLKKSLKSYEKRHEIDICFFEESKSCFIDWYQMSFVDGLTLEQWIKKKCLLRMLKLIEHF